MAREACHKCFHPVGEGHAFCPTCGAPRQPAHAERRSSIARPRGSKGGFEGSNMSWGWVAPVIVGAILFGMNPSEGAHDQRLRELLSEQHPVASFLGVGHLAVRMTQYQSFGLFSITRHEGKVVTWGFLGKVFP